MVKINLLPGYIYEKGRILLTVVVFVVLLAGEGGVLMLAKQDIEGFKTKYTEDTPKFAGDKAKIDEAASKAKDWETKSGTYTALIEWFTGKTVLPYAATLKKTLAEAPTKLKPPGQGNIWFSELTIEDKKVTATGQIKGLTNFVNYYFAMKEKGATVAITGAKPEIVEGNRNATFDKTLDVSVSADLSESLPTKGPDGPSEAKEWTELMKIGNGGGAGGADGAAGGAPGGAAPPAGGAAPPAGGASKN